ncbi:ECF transporter S component [Nocardioides bruguierae]|uniref:ECF transporter S component n=1 Tax=Nocardioides bruguierae TaxID=2945102 RepID=UPI002020594F|nr:ECF transporter S component [Nocardioides bruguierae]MCL8025744.1 hypothetical protein [Nocardioides bruguierae]
MNDAGGPAVSRWDEVAEGLADLRRRQGDPSFAEIARQVSLTRQAGGETQASSRIARSTVFDCFKTGRTRMNLPLVREIADALGAEPGLVDAWVAAGLEQARGAVAPRKDASPAEDVSTGPAVEPGAGVAADEDRSEDHPEDHPGQATASAAAPAPTPAGSGAAPDATETEAAVRAGAVTTAERPHEELPPPGVPATLAVMLVCLIIDLLGRELVLVAGLPLHLDMLGTAAAAMLLGPWRGAAVGLAMNVAGVITFSGGPPNWDSLAFIGVNVVGALIWGYGVHSWGWGRTLPRLLGMSLVVAVVSSIQAVPILVLVFDSLLQVGQDFISQALYQQVPSTAFSMPVANLIVSVADKVISTFVGLSLAALAPRAMRGALERNVPLVRQ